MTESRDNLQVRNPYDQEIVAELSYDTDESMLAKLEKANRAFCDWRRIPITERMIQVREGLEKFLAHGEDIARNVSLQMGKTIAQARGEVQTVRERGEFMLSIAEEALADELLPAKAGLRRAIRHEPLGVVLNLAAWNYPLIIPVNVLVPALIAGNSILLKHSAKTPLCGLAFEEAFGELAVPNLVQNLILTHAGTARLIEQPAVAHVSFTGSVEGGRSVYRAAASRLIDVGLELGGKDPAYVAADADLESAVENIVDGACYNAGQSCCAVERVYVHRSHYDEFLERAEGLMKAYVLGDPFLDATTMGPLVSAGALDFLESQVQDANSRGARLICGGRRLADSPGNFFEPTLIADLGNDASAMREESFGPLLPVMAVDDDERALELMNDSDLGLTASVWTANSDLADRMAADLRAGTVFQNRCDYLDPALPWTGWGESGKGSTLSRHGFLHLTQRKSLHFRTAGS